MPHRRFNLKEVASYLHIPVQDVEGLVQQCQIPFERQGGKPVFLKKEVDAWASQRILGLAQPRLESYHRGSSAGMHKLSRSHAIVTQLARESFVEAALSSRTKASVIRDMAKLAGKSGLVVYPDELVTSLQEREALCSTGLPGGLALLHPRHHDPYIFTESFIALGRAIHPIPFGAPDGKPTDLFFLICCQDDAIHLHVLARLCMMCQQTKLLPRLREAENAEQMLQTLVKSEDAVIGALES